jgi:hypothetical protein
MAAAKSVSRSPRVVGRQFHFIYIFFARGTTFACVYMRENGVAWTLLVCVSCSIRLLLLCYVHLVFVHSALLLWRGNARHMFPDESCKSFAETSCRVKAPFTCCTLGPGVWSFPLVLQLTYFNSPYNLGGFSLIFRMNKHWNKLSLFYVAPRWLELIF